MSPHMGANATAVVRVCDQLLAELCGETVKVHDRCSLHHQMRGPQMKLKVEE